MGTEYLEQIIQWGIGLLVGVGYSVLVFTTGFMIGRAVGRKENK